MPDEGNDAHYEAIVQAIKGVAQQGIVVDFPNVPHPFLREITVRSWLLSAVT